MYDLEELYPTPGRKAAAEARIQARLSGNPQPVEQPTDEADLAALLRAVQDEADLDAELARRELAHQPTHGRVDELNLPPGAERAALRRMYEAGAIAGRTAPLPAPENQTPSQRRGAARAERRRKQRAAREARKRNR